MSSKAQAEVASFIADHKLGIDPIVRLLDLISELGEVAKEVLKGTNYGKPSRQGLVRRIR